MQTRGETMKPVIGISTYFVEAYENRGSRVRGREDQDMLMSTMDYSESVLKGGGIPLAIAPIFDMAYLDSVLDKVDGLLLSGGGDINPRLYGEAHHKKLGMLEPRRDDIEIYLIEKAIEKNMPILGICRGYQLLNVYFGGSLIQNLESDYDTRIEHVAVCGRKSSVTHTVTFEKGSLYQNIYGKHQLEVNSLHHQAIKSLGEGLIESGKSEDGLIEAIEHESYKNLVAVQWHPEMMIGDHPIQLKLFKYFIDEICSQVSK